MPPAMNLIAVRRVRCGLLCTVMLLAGCAPAAPPAPQPTAAAAVPIATQPPPPPPPTLEPTRTPPPPTAAPPPPTPVPTATARPRPSLGDAVSEALSNHRGTIGVAIRRLDGTDSAAFNADQRFRSASLYKLFLLVAAMARIENGTLDPQETLIVSQALVDSDPFSDFLPGTRVTVDCALRTMIEMSGNSAADLFEERLGLAAVNTQIGALGLRQSSINEAGASTSAADMALLLGAIGRGEVVSQTASRRMLDLLGAQEQNDRIPVALPLSVAVAHKTGELPGLRHDAAIVFAPSGAYVIATLVQDAPDEAEARAAIIDVSRAAYDALEPRGLETTFGIPPRLARDVFRTTDAEGRMALLSDPRTETVLLASTGVDLADNAENARLRPEAVADLVSLQRTAAAAGVPFWVTSGFLRPTEAEAGRAVPVAWLQPCALSQPDRTPDLRVRELTPTGVQHWLGTVVTISDTHSGEPTQSDDGGTGTGRWLLANAWEHGFVPSLPEDASNGAREPWTWRWVGRDMAARMRAIVTSPAYAAQAINELRSAEAALQAQNPRAKQPPPWGLDRCWTVATSSGRGCASRWYFLPLPGF